MTKYYQDRHKFDKNSDTPISVRDYQNTYEDRTLICSFCNRTMQRLWDPSRENPSWFCSACQIETSSEEADNLRTRSRLQMPEGVNTTPYASTKFPDISVGKKPIEPRGTFAALQRRGIKITNYEDTVKS
jgi:hypothetical protein